MSPVMSVTSNSTSNPGSIVVVAGVGGVPGTAAFLVSSGAFSCSSSESLHATRVTTSRNDVTVDPSLVSPIARCCSKWTTARPTRRRSVSTVWTSNPIVAHTTIGIATLRYSFSLWRWCAARRTISGESSAIARNSWSAMVMRPSTRRGTGRVGTRPRKMPRARFSRCCVLSSTKLSDGAVEAKPLLAGDDVEKPAASRGGLSGCTPPLASARAVADAALSATFMASGGRASGLPCVRCRDDGA